MGEQEQHERTSEEESPEGRSDRSGLASDSGDARIPTPTCLTPRPAALLSAGAFSGAAGAVLVGVLDFVFTSARLRTVDALELVRLGLGTMTTLIAAGTIAGCLLGLLMIPGLVWLRWPRWPRFTCWLQATMVSAPLAGLGVWMVLKWVGPHWAELGGGGRAVGLAAAVLAGIGCIVLTRVVLLQLSRYENQTLGRAHWIAMAVCGAALGVSQAVDHLVLVGLYEYAHFGLGVAAMVAAGVLARLAWRRLEAVGRGRMMSRVGATVAVLGICGAVAIEAGAQESAYIQHTTVTAKARSVMRSAFDYDGDGFTGVVGGGDCNDLDPDIAPTVFEVPENGIDDNCAAGDATWPQPTEAPPAPDIRCPNCNVVLLLLDATRADHVGAYGYGRNTTPNIDRLARESLVFTRAYSQSTKTFYSVPSLFLSRYPSNIPRNETHRSLRRTKSHFYYVPPVVPSLPELLDDAGYETVGCSQENGPYASGLQRGFDVRYYSRHLTTRALRRLKSRKKRPFFLFVLYPFPHAPYVKHPKFHFGDRPIDRYDGEIALADARVGRVIRTLKKRRLYDKTIVIVSADHGEEFGEHGGKFHGPRLYDELLHVPLIVRIPGGPTGEVRSLVELVDITPMLLEVLGLSRGEQYFDGVNLLSALTRTQERPAYSELGPTARVSRAWTTDRYKMIVHAQKPTVELYDLQADPGETVNLAQRLPEVSASLREAADLRGVASQSSIISATRAGPFPPRSLRHLRRIGVLHEVLKGLQPPILPGLRTELSRVAKRDHLGPEVCHELERLGVEVKRRERVCARRIPNFGAGAVAFPRRDAQ